jgi:hypothetical protein
MECMPRVEVPVTVSVPLPYATRGNLYELGQLIVSIQAPGQLVLIAYRQSADQFRDACATDDLEHPARLGVPNAELVHRIEEQSWKP